MSGAVIHGGKLAEEHERERQERLRQLAQGGGGNDGGGGGKDHDDWDDDESGPEDDVQLPLLGHLAELRNRLKWSVLAVFGGFALSWGFADRIHRWLMAPVFAALPEDERILYFTGAVEPFFVYLKVAVYTGIFIAAPVILYQVWAFIAPGLYRTERRIAAPFVILGTLFFVAGGAFAHYVVLPFAFEFLVGEFSRPELRPMLTMGEQLSLILTMTLAFALVFEMPVLLALLAKLGVVQVKTLRNIRRYALVVNVAAAAIITPTGDPFNLMLMAVPMVICYEIGILMATLVAPGSSTESDSESGSKSESGARSESESGTGSG